MDGGTSYAALSTPGGYDELGAATASRIAPAWVRWAGLLLSVTILVAVARALGTRELRDLPLLMPRTPAFWLLLACLLAAQPLADFAIFRLLWRLPATGLAALFRKAALNELVLGYTGELQFYLWARRNAGLRTSPFGAVRDVAVLSALAGNVLAIVLLAIALPVLVHIGIGDSGDHLAASAVVVTGSSLAMLVFRRHLFSLSAAQFRAVAVTHLARAVVVAILFALLWHMVDPTVGLGWWILLTAARQIITRLPFLPTKDLVFAGLAAHLLPQSPHIGVSVALVATLFAAGQVLIGSVVAAAHLAAPAVSQEAR